ncbi:MAG: extracellular solute-binding protein [Eubacterium sp.]|nr:extracellular solute-binding protein [Eubacterium sp.]
MKKYFKAMAGALALLTAVSAIAGCSTSSSGGTSNDTGANNSSESSVDAGPTLTSDENVQSAVGELTSNVEDEVSGIEVTDKLIWLAWWKIDENSPEISLFKELYGVPENVPDGYTAADPGDVFINLNTSYAERYNNLAKYVQSGDSPDCFPFEIGNYPYSIYSNLFQNVDDLFNFEDDLWADTKDVIELLKWGEHYYCPVVSIGCNTVLWYRKSIAAQAGVEDPWTQFQNGEWNWDTFMETCRAFTDPDNGKYAIDGWYFQKNILATTGTPLIGMEDGKLVGNFNNANIEKAMDMLIKFDDEAGESLRYPREILNGWGTNPREWNAGNVLFLEDGKWAFEGQTSVGGFKRLNKDWDEDEVQFVPYPQMPGSDKYYQPMKVDPIMLVASAKNIDGYKAWIYCNAYTSKDESVSEAFNQQFMESYECPQYIMDNIAIIEDPETFTAIFDFMEGIGPDIASGDNGDTPLQTLTFYPYMNGTPYTVQRAEVLPVIQNRIDELNATIS